MGCRDIYRRNTSVESESIIMVDITSKSNTLRQAIASATITVSKQETIDAIRNKQVPKGDVFEFSRAAGLLAIKKTSDVIPDCHPLPIEFAAIRHDIIGLTIQVTVEVHTIYKTGVEVEAMHGAAVTALTMYDMLKPLDTGVEITNIRLVEKKGGKSDRLPVEAGSVTCAVVVCSDTVSAGKAEDQSGKSIVQRMEQLGLQVKAYTVLPDNVQQIQDLLHAHVQDDIQLVLFTGGTGLSPRDVTPDAIEPLLDRQVPGIMEVARNYGQQRTPYAMLSRGVAGYVKNTLVITLPGSVKGVKETMDAIFPQVLHLFSVAKGERHS